MVRQVIVPLDGSPFGEQALPYAVRLAKAAKASLQLVRVHVPLASMYTASEVLTDLMLEATLRDRDRQYLDRLRESVERSLPGAVTAVVLDGPMIEALAEHLAAVKADLVVMTTHGRGPLSRVWLGSVADKLVRRLSMPIVLVRPQDAQLDLARSPDLGRILVPLDGSEMAERILEPALEIGQLVQAEYVLLRVVEPFLVPDYPLGASLAGVSPPSLHQRIEQDVRDYIERKAQQLRARSVRVQTRVVIDRPPSEAIMEEARIQKCSLIALESHGRGGLSRLFLGSVADRVIRGSSVPVLVHHPLSQKG
jgi:nucleotide-binding universal stress UspA family protein